ncbi:MAG: hypothetical protein ACRDUA_23890, partial [Micromonosporaceae bacterium]
MHAPTVPLSSWQRKPTTSLSLAVKVNIAAAAFVSRAGFVPIVGMAGAVRSIFTSIAFGASAFPASSV